MENNTLAHHGVKGMKWGIRRTPEQLGYKTNNLKKNFGLEKNQKKTKERNGKKSKVSTVKKKSISELSDEELRKKIDRLQLEKKYKDLLGSEGKEKVSFGKKFISESIPDILNSSAKNIGTQTVTYMMGEAVNRIAGSKIVNPKKGQKDK